MFYSYIYVLFLESVTAYRKEHFLLDHKLSIRTYRHIKDTTTSILEVTFFVFLGNVMNFTHKELTLFIIGTLLVFFRHIVISLEKRRK